MEFPPLLNDLLLRAAMRQPIERSPVWIMRQAGRYLPEFRQVRSQHDFFEICQSPALACEVTLQPIRRYSGLLDASIIFSDILVIPQAFGMTVEMLAGSGPHFPHPIRTIQHAQEILNRHVDVHASLNYVYQAITLTRKELKGQVPLIGFCGAPWTLLAYMIEGGSSKTFSQAKTWLWDHTDMSLRLLDRIAQVCAEFLIGQIESGAQMLQVFDSWAGELTPADFQQFSLPFLSKIASLVKTAHPNIPITIFAKGANHALELLCETEYDVIGLDWTISPSEAKRRIRGKKALQGNSDPSLLYADKAAIDRYVKEMFLGADGFGLDLGHVTNLGHGITPGVDPEHLRWYLEAVHKHSQRQFAASTSQLEHQKL